MFATKIGEVGKEVVIQDFTTNLTKPVVIVVVKGVVEDAKTETDEFYFQI